MATVEHRFGEQQASVPRVVLPITSRGLELTDRACSVILGAAMALSAGLILYLNRGTTFYLDELPLVYTSPDRGLTETLEPVNGHLLITFKVLFKAVLETFGADYVVLRLIAVVMILVTAALFYVLAKRRVGALPALAPTVVLLFFGSAFSHVLIPVGFGVFTCMAAGLGALLALERGDLRGDIAASALVSLSIATFTIGLAFLVGVAISVLLRPDRHRRAWIFLVPLALYAAWFLWALGQPTSAEGEAKLSNVLLIPAWIAESLALDTAALIGLDYDFSAPVPNDLSVPNGATALVDIAWGRVLAVVAVLALALRISRRNVPTSLWVSLGTLVAYWSIAALAAEPALRVPALTRYVVPGSVLVLLVATDAARSVRFSRLGLLALFVVCAMSLATNLALMRDGAAFFRNDYSPRAQAQFTVLELARGRVDPGFQTERAVPDFSPVGAVASTYFEVADRYGSLAFSLPELELQPAPIRGGADQMLAEALDLGLEPTMAGPRGPGCNELRSEEPGGAITFELPPGELVLEARSAGPAEVTVGRFGSAPSASLGNLSPGERVGLRIPNDTSQTPWRASVADAESVEVCPLRR